LDGTNYLDAASAFTIVRVKSKSLRVMIAQLTDFRAARKTVINSDR
jgi:hypothetical protein